MTNRKRMEAGVVANAFLNVLYEDKIKPIEGLVNHLIIYSSRDFYIDFIETFKDNEVFKFLTESDVYKCREYVKGETFILNHFNADSRIYTEGEIKQHVYSFNKVVVDILELDHKEERFFLLDVVNDFAGELFIKPEEIRKFKKSDFH